MSQDFDALTSPDSLSTLLDQIIEDSTPIRKGPKCGLGRLLETLPPGEADKLVFLLDKSDRPHGAIAWALNQAGYAIKPYTVARHRRRLRNDTMSPNYCDCP